MVQPGDYLELNGGGLLHRITGVSSGSITLASTVSGPATTNYRIIRQPQPLAGQPSLQLPADVAIDVTSGTSGLLTLSTITTTPPTLPVNPAGTGYDILFSPSGAVITRGTVGDRIILWVRDTNQTDPKQGGTILLSINVRTGLIASVPVDTTSGDPYSLARDPQASGM